MKVLTTAQKVAIAEKYGWEYAALNAVALVEGAGHGYDPKTGLILIQFEKHWFKRKNEDWRADTIHTLWQSNNVGSQAVEWPAYRSAYASDQEAAMLSTSWGMMQVMGFNHLICGFKTVREMVKFAEESEANQLELGCRFIKANPKLDRALKNKDWRTFAYHYNGEEYEKFNYHNRMLEAYIKSGGVMPISNDRTTTTSVHMRTGAGTQYKSMKVVKPGVKVTELYTAGVWSYVNDGKDKGWISTQYLRK